MKIQYASDLHLEFRDNADWLRRHPLKVTGDVLVLAGDVMYIGGEIGHNTFWDWAAANYSEVLCVPGNHEFYGGYDIDTLHEGWELRLRDNVRYCYNKVVQIGDTDFVLSTLWSHIEPMNAVAVEYGVNDFTYIRRGKERLTWERFNEEHCRCKAFVEKSVRESTARHIVVVTHHVPSAALTDRRFLGSPINDAFTIEMGDYIADSRIDCWIYGHSHRNICREIGRTRCVSNQLCYVAYREHATFRRDTVVEV